MKRIKSLLLVMVLAITCVAFSACSKDPKSLKGEEVNRYEWLQAFEYVSNGIAGKDESSSFTFNGTLKQYEKASDDEDKELVLLIDYSMQVNKKVMYLEASVSYYFENETYEETGYLYVDNTEKEQLIYSSQDHEKWKEGYPSSSSSNIDTIVKVFDELKKETLKFNKKTGMYEKFELGTGYSKLKFYDGKIVYVTAVAENMEAEYSFTNYGKTEIKQEKPTVEKNKLVEAYDAVKNSTNPYTYVTLSDDCSYMTFTYYGSYNGADFQKINTALGLPSGSLVTKMRETTELSQRDSYEQDGIIVTWLKKGEDTNSSNGGIYEVTYVLK